MPANLQWSMPKVILLKRYIEYKVEDTFKEANNSYLLKKKKKTNLAYRLLFTHKEWAK